MEGILGLDMLILDELLILARGRDGVSEGRHTWDHTLEFLASQMQNDDFVLIWPSFFAVEKASLLQNRNLFRQVVIELEQ